MPTFELTAENGEQVQLERPSRHTMYFFGGVGCGVCREVLPELELAAAELSDQLSIVVILDGEERDGLRTVIRSKLLPVYIDRTRESFNKLGIAATPFVLVTDQHGRIGARGSPRRRPDFVALASALQHN